MSVDAKRRRLRALLAERQDVEAARHVDLCVVWELPNGETLLIAGGQWDREERRYTGKEAEFGVVYKLQPSQVEAATQLAWWMADRKAGRPRDWVTLQLMGNRGAGKTALAAVAMVTLLVEFPTMGGKPSVGWMVSKAHTEQEELDREIADNFPSRWYTYDTEDYQYRFLHGPKLTNISAAHEGKTKRGRTDYLLLNEAQKVTKRSYLNALARVSDKGGCSILTGNWTLEGRSGAWLYELEEKRKEAESAGKTWPIRLVNMDAAGNLTRDKATAAQVDVIIRALDPQLAATDLDGLQMPPTDRAYWAWDRVRNLRRPPDAAPDNIVRNITREITSRRTFRRQGYDFVVGCDFQRYGGMWAIIHKIFGLPESPILWAVDEISVDGTEEDLIAELISNGYTPENSLIVGDGSGRWQDGAHSPGRNSFKVFKDARFNPVGPVPQKDEEHRPKNPKFDDRARLHNFLLKQGLYCVDPLGAPILGEAMAKCEVRPGMYGQGRPRPPWSHPTDAAGYAALWLYGEKLRKTPAPGTKLYEALPSIYADRYRVST